MQPPIADKMENLFGFGWKSLYAEAMDISSDTVTRMNPATETTMIALYEFLSETDSEDWPERWSKLRRLMLIKDLKSQLVQLGGC